jgi:hypothetical protein
MILGIGMTKRMGDAQFAKFKLEKDNILATKHKSCCKNSCLKKFGTQGIRPAQEKYI